MMGRKLIIACVSSLLVVTLLSGCVSSLLGMTGGAGDWTFSLPNNYFVAHINNASIIMGKGSDQQSSGPTIIEPYVMGLCYNSRYVAFDRFLLRQALLQMKSPALLRKAPPMTIATT